MLRDANIHAGVQVYADDHVICWIGDIQEALQPVGTFQLRSKAVPPPVLFHTSVGSRALTEAASWLRKYLAEHRARG